MLVAVVIVAAAVMQPVQAARSAPDHMSPFAATTYDLPLTSTRGADGDNTPRWKPNISLSQQTGCSGGLVNLFLG